MKPLIRADLIMLIGALAAPGLAADRPWRVHLSENQLTAISRHCHSPRHWFRNGVRGVRVVLDPGTTYDHVDCVLAELKKRHAIVVGLITGEAPTPSEMPAH